VALSGEKWVITFWMRDGVSHEEPWELYDASGVKILEGESGGEGEDDDEEGFSEVEVLGRGEL